MVGCFEGFAAAVGGGWSREQLLVHLQVALKIERVTRSPALLPRQRCKELSAKCRGVSAPHGTWLGFACRLWFVAGDRQGPHRQGQQRFSLQQSKKVAVQR